MGTINNKNKLLKKLKITSLDQLKDSEIQKEFIPIASTLSPELIKEAITAVPELAKVLTEVIKSMKDVGVSLEETKRVRWEALKKAADSGILTGEQFLDAMKIIQEIEKKEHIDWNKLLDIVRIGVGALVFVIATVLIFGIRQKND